MQVLGASAVLLYHFVWDAWIACQAGIIQVDHPLFMAFADSPSDEPENDAPDGPMEAFEGAAQEGFRVDVSSLADMENADK